MISAEAHPRTSLPALLRHARATYGAAMRIALAQSGYDDIPESGLYLIGRLALAGESLPIGRLVDELGVTKQGAGQLVDTLVTRGYMTRTPSETDRRQLFVALTDRGRAAAAVQTRARKSIDAELADLVPEADIESTRRTLEALVEIGKRSVNTPRTQEKKLMADTERFQDRRLDDVVFENCSMVRSRFEDINLSQTVFEDVSLRGARFTNVNLTSVSIEDAKIEGLTILGYDICKLIRDHEARSDRKIT